MPRPLASVVAAVLIAAAVPGPAVAAPGRLEGWRGLLFGMPPSTAQATMHRAPDQRGDDPATMVYTGLPARSPFLPTRFGTWTAAMLFDADGLDTIELSARPAYVDADPVKRFAEARGVYQQTLQALVADYGAADLVLPNATRDGGATVTGRALWRFADGATVALRVDALHDAPLVAVTLRRSPRQSHPDN